MGFKAMAVAQAIIYLINDAKKKNLIEEIAIQVDTMSDKQLHGRSEGIQIKAVEDVLIPLCRELLWDSKEGKIAYRAAVAKEFQAVNEHIGREYPEIQ